VVRYAGGSLVATVCSEVTLVLLYGPAGLDPAWAAVLAWVAGAVPNYWLNRSWAWERRGRPSLRREIVPYAAIILITLLLASLATTGVDRWLHHLGTDEDVRVVLVAVVFLAVYVVVFGLRFLLLDRLSNHLAKHDEPEPVR
jgi:putative flippase GtrA